MTVGLIGGVVAVLVIGLLILIVLICEGRRRPEGRPQFVALGSSFAAGIGLGPRVPPKSTSSRIPPSPAY